MNKVRQSLLNALKEVRYCATYQNRRLDTSVRPDLQGASSSESDKYEEIIVNPTLLTLVQQRGNIDCGGVNYVVICYGHFFQFVQPIRGGHISVALEPTTDLTRVLPELARLIRKKIQ